MANDTILFKDVVGSYEDFISSEVASVTISKMNVYGMAVNNQKPQKVSPEIWCPEVYRVLLRHYRNSQIAFDNVSDFLDFLWERLETHVPNFYRKKALYERYISMSDTDLLDNGVSIINEIENTDDRADDVFDLLKNITSQTQNKNISGLSSRLRSYLYNINADLIRDFTRKFEGLFLRLSSSANYFG